MRLFQILRKNAGKQVTGARKKSTKTQRLGTVKEVAASWGMEARLAQASSLAKAYEACLAATVETSPRSRVQAGSANTALGKITLNPALLAPGREADRNATLLHECAHILADLAHRQNCRHDKRWKHVMALLGEPPAVNHDLTYLSAKFHARVTWACLACGEEYYYIRKPRRRPQDCYCPPCGPRLGRLHVVEGPYQLALSLPASPEKERRKSA